MPIRKLALRKYGSGDPATAAYDVVSVAVVRLISPTFWPLMAGVFGAIGAGTPSILFSMALKIAIERRCSGSP